MFLLVKMESFLRTMAKLQLKKKNTSSVFLFYLLKTKEYYLSNLTKGTGIPHVDGLVLENLSLPFPPLPEQQKLLEFFQLFD